MVENCGRARGPPQARSVKDIWAGSTGGDPNLFTAIGSTLYFSASDGINGTELWKSDGNSSGTLMVKDIYSGSSSSSIGELTAIGSTLYFRAGDGIHQIELWKSDGTTSGTVMVKDINTNNGVAFLGSGYPSLFTSVGETIYFKANDGVYGTELWKSDGTASGTSMVKDISPGDSSYTFWEFTPVGNAIYFVVQTEDGLMVPDITSEGELWVYFL